MTINFQAFQLSDKPILDRYFAEHHYEQSECAFATLFIWQHAFDLSWAVADDVLFIKAERYGETFMLPPFSGENNSFVNGLHLAQDWFDDNGLPFLLKGASPWVVERMKELCPNCYEFTADRDNFEYIYLTEELMALAGKKFRDKRNHVNGFLRSYPNYTYQPLTAADKEQCMALSLAWLNDHQTTEDMEVEQRGIAAMFDYWETLDIRGGAIVIDGKVVAFSIGEYLNPDMAVIHVEKAAPDVRGAYQMINREFVRHAWADTTYINREEDMGIPGLRRAKESYNPHHFAEKYDVRLIDDCECDE